MAADTGSQYSVELDKTEDTIVMSLGGELDVAAAPYLRERLAEAVSHCPRVVRIDLSAADFLCSLAVGLLVAMNRRVRSYGGSFSITTNHSSAGRKLKLMGLGDYLQISP